VVEELAYVGVVGPEHGEVVTLASRYACFFEFELDAGRCPPQPRHQFVGPAVGSANNEGRWGIGQFGEPGDPGDPAIGTPVAQVCPAKPNSWVGDPAVIAVPLRHGRKSRTRGDRRGLGRRSGGAVSQPGMDLPGVLEVQAASFGWAARNG
jgi:hypothetical protein